MVPLAKGGIFVVVSVLTGIFFIVWRVSALILYELHTYLVPDDSYNQAAGNEAPKNGNETGNSTKYHKKRRKDKDNFYWNEKGSQILRIHIGDTHLQRKRYYHEYDRVVMYASLAVANIVTSEILRWNSKFYAIDGIKSADYQFCESFIPLIVSLFSAMKLIYILSQVSWEKGSFRNSEWILSCGIGFLGFLFAIAILFGMPSLIIDPELDKAISLATAKSPHAALVIKALLAVVSGWLTGLLLSPALKSIRCYWMGTNQLKWDIALMDSGTCARFLLHLNIAMPILTTLIWMKPMSDSFVADPAAEKFMQQVHTSEQSEYHFLHPSPMCESRADPIACAEVPRRELVDNDIHKELANKSPDNSILFQNRDRTLEVRLTKKAFENMKLFSLLLTGLLQICLFRVNMQAYLNVAVLFWYEGLHLSRICNMEAIRTRVLLINYYMCRIAIQMLVPGMLIILFLALSRSSGCHVSVGSSEEFTPMFFRPIMIFLSWWTALSWAVLTSTTLALYRFEVLLVA